MQNPQWVAADWSPSRLRIWLMDAAGGIIDCRSGDGEPPAPERFEETLIDLLGAALPTSGPLPVICCGATTAPLVPCPCAPPTVAAAHRVKTADRRLQVFFLPGVKQRLPPDIIYADATRIAGFLSKEPDFDGVLCLPGDHSRWVHISAGEIVSFRSFMTGELFSALARHSVLRHSVATDSGLEPAFLEALTEAMSRPAGVASQLFSIHAETVFGAQSTEAARAHLAGLLLGLELAGARAYWLGRDIVVLGDGQCQDAYCQALTAQAASIRAVSGHDMLLNGLRSAWAQMAG